MTIRGDQGAEASWGDSNMKVCQIVRGAGDGNGSYKLELQTIEKEQAFPREKTSD